MDMAETFGDNEVTEELSMKWDQIATKKIKTQYGGGGVGGGGAASRFPIPLKKLEIKFGSAFVFNAKNYLHAGGPGKSLSAYLPN
jgi:hypothetical protein